MSDADDKNADASARRIERSLRRWHYREVYRLIGKSVGMGLPITVLVLLYLDVIGTKEPSAINAVIGVLSAIGIILGYGIGEALGTWYAGRGISDKDKCSS